MTLPLFFFTKTTEMKVKDFCLILNITLQDKENGGGNSRILEAVPVKVRPRVLATQHDIMLSVLHCSEHLVLYPSLWSSNPDLETHSSHVTRIMKQCLPVSKGKLSPIYSSIPNQIIN